MGGRVRRLCCHALIQDNTHKDMQRALVFQLGLADHWDQ